MKQSHHNSNSTHAGTAPSTIHVGTATWAVPLTRNEAAHSPTDLGTGALVRPVELSSNALFPSLSKQAIGLLFTMALLVTSAWSQGMSKSIMSPPANVRPPYLENVGIEQRLNFQLPSDLAFTDDMGKSVKLGDYFGKKPLILNLVYYKCTMLCGEALAGLTGAMKMIKFDVGNEYDVVTVSFNPKETIADAATKKADFVKRYGRPGAAAGWHFLTGSAESINALTKAVGFQYQYDAKRNQYAHVTAIPVLTPQGHISRYFYGVDFPPKDLRLGLVEASQEKIGNAVDQVLCIAITTIPQRGSTAQSSATC